MQELLDFIENIDNESPYLNWEEIQSEISTGLLGYVRVGYCLEKVRYLKLYKQSGFKDFKKYCQQILRISGGYAHQLIQAANVTLNLIRAGFEQVPNCAAQAMKLIQYNVVDPAGNWLLGEKWQEILTKIPEGNPITAAKIEEILQGPKEKAKNLKVRQDTYHRLKEMAERRGITVDELLDRFLDEWEEQNTEPVEPEPEAMQRWEEDLQELVKEREKVTVTPPVKIHWTKIASQKLAAIALQKRKGRESLILDST